MTDFTPARLAELRAVAEAATQGSRAVEGSRVTTAEGSTIGQAWGVNWKNDQRFMAEATPGTVLALIAALEAERSHMQSLAKWVGVDETTPSLEIACEASAALEAKTAEVDYWQSRWNREDGYRIDADRRAEKAEQERDDLEERLSGFLCEMTGGKLSKTGYDVRTMVMHAEEENQRWVDAAVKEAEERAEKAEAAREELQGVLERVKALPDLARHEEAHLDCCGGKGYCDHCYNPWPCPTIQAIQGAAE